jgi:opacity protein-like surface antigen
VRGFILTLLVLICGAEDVYAAKKDFKGLFGSYRREKFTENEARSSDLGMDIMLSTLIPVTSVANSSETSATSGTPLAFSTFFNVEASVFYSINYNWQAFLNIGYYNYETRKENGSITTQPLFHHFEMTAYPATAGIKYRFSMEDIVPYIGIGGGIAHVKRYGSYDSDSSGSLGAVDYSNVLTFSVITGVEFYFMPRMGVRLEMAAMFLKLNPLNYNPSPSSMDRVPALFFQANVWTLRYASGIFFLF